MRKSNGFRWKALSQRQKMVLCWWTPQSAYSGYNGIIADGAIRSGKTFAMSFSFVQWAMTCYSGQQFAMCGKTIASFRRNVLGTLKQQLAARGYNVKERRAENCMTVSKGGRTNEFYFFGGKDESSQDLIQGITLAGAFFDEVALMPQSFVNQATARCSVTGSKFWFNCNPGSPQHWFYLEWVRKCRSRKMMYLHFTMDDNLSLSEDIKARYRSQYSGVFYQRYILGLWTVAEGLVYDMFDRKKHVVDVLPALSPKSAYVACDFGTQNATVFLLLQKQADAEDTILPTAGLYFRGRCILLVEDNELNSEIAVEILKEMAERSQAGKDHCGPLCPAPDYGTAQEWLYPDPRKQRRSERHSGRADHAADRAVEDLQRLQAHAGRVWRVRLGSR